MSNIDQITISNGTTTITMPRTKTPTVSGEVVANETIMASGKSVKDIIGYRAVVTAEWDYVPADTMAALVAMLRTGGYFTVGYPDPDGTDKSAKFSISIPSPGIFKFNGTVPMWHKVSLTMTAQEVV